MSNLTQFLGTGNNFPLITRYFISSGSFVAPCNGWATFLLVGAGGAGGLAQNGSIAQTVATGGGAGATCIKRAYVTAGQTFTITLGAGGTYTPTGSNTERRAGVAGGNSTITASGFTTMTANGGGGGAGAFSLDAQSGGAGGTASGGDANLTGGRGGNTVDNTGGNACRQTGGGGVNIYGTGYNGGDVTAVVSGGTRCGTGGGGIGSAGVDNFNSNSYSNGGSSLEAGKGINLTNIPATASREDLLAVPFYGLPLFGTNGINATAGGGGNAASTSGGAGGMFGGGGANSGSTNSITPSVGGIGGGSGGTAGANITFAADPRGGAGFAMVLFHGA